MSPGLSRRHGCTASRWLQKIRLGMAGYAFGSSAYELRSFAYDTTLSGATFSASRFSPIARAMKRAVIGVPS
jgi:hypothetical protein